MEKTVKSVVVERRRGLGVKRAYGYPGDSNNGILGASNRTGNDAEFVQVRHEEVAPFFGGAAVAGGTRLWWLEGRRR